MRLTSKSVLVVLLFIGSATWVQAQSDVCNVTTYWVEEGVGSTSRFRIGVFNAAPIDEQITKSIKHQESGLTIRVGVEYFEKTPERVRLAIAFTGEPENIFEEFERAEAETSHGQGWTGMSISKSIKVGNREYTYTLTCEKDRKKEKKPARHSTR